MIVIGGFDVAYKFAGKGVAGSALDVGLCMFDVAVAIDFGLENGLYEAEFGVVFFLA